LVLQIHSQHEIGKVLAQQRQPFLQSTGGNNSQVRVGNNPTYCGFTPLFLNIDLGNILYWYDKLTFLYIYLFYMYVCTKASLTLNDTILVRDAASFLEQARSNQRLQGEMLARLEATYCPRSSYRIAPLVKYHPPRSKT
jgi:hypothetical protein